MRCATSWRPETMTDLERDLSTRLHHRSEEVVPGQDFPDRIRARVEGHRHRRRLLLGVVPVVACLAIGISTLLAFVLPGSPNPSLSLAARGPGRSSVARSPHSSKEPQTSSAQANSPAFGVVQVAGIHVDFANGQISVPPGSVFTSIGCPDSGAPVTVELGNVGVPQTDPICFQPTGATKVSLTSVQSNASTIGLHRTSVHGVTVFLRSGSATPTEVNELVPSLGLNLQADGPLASQVAGTLSPSPRVRVLAGGRSPRVPPSWRRITDGGLRVSVPSRWPLRHVADWGSSCETPMPWEPPIGDVSSAVTLDAGKMPPTVVCPDLAVSLDQPVSAPDDGLIIDPGPDGPLSGVTSFGTCQSMAKLRVCPVQSDFDGQLVLRVREPGGATVAVIIGLGGNRQTARTILRSLRPA